MQSQVRFSRVSEKVLEKVWEALVQSQVRSNRVPEKVPGEGLGDFGARQVRFNGFCRRFLRRPGRLWCRAKSGSAGFRRRFWRRSGKLWCRARSGPTGFRRRFPEKVPGSLAANPSQVQRVL